MRGTKAPIDHPDLFGQWTPDGGWAVPDADWRPPRIEDLPSFRNAKRVSFDTETYDPHLRTVGPSVRHGGYVAGVSFAVEGMSRGFYLPLAHQGGDNMPNPGAAIRWLRDQLSVFSGELVFMNASYDLDWLMSLGLPVDKFPCLDVAIADPLINELHTSYSLNAIAHRWGFPSKAETLLEQACERFGFVKRGMGPKQRQNAIKSSIHKLPARYVGQYAEQDAVLPLLILREQEKEIEKQNLQGVWELERQVTPILVRMRRKGLKIDTDQLQRVEQWAFECQRRLCDRVSSLSGRRLAPDGLWQTGVLAPILRDAGVPLGITRTGQPEIIGAVLDHHPSDIVQMIARARKLSKLTGTFAQSIRTCMTSQGRIHPTFNQMRGESEDGEEKGAAFGRLSSSNPNVQQQPARDPWSMLWRAIYVADEGAIWAAPDLSQQEPRWLAHWAHVLLKPLPRPLELRTYEDRLQNEAAIRRRSAIQAAEKMVRAYNDDPKADNHDLMTRLIHGDDIYQRAGAKEYKVLRTACKQIFLGLCYGMGGAKLARELGLSTKWIKTRAGRYMEVAGDEAQQVLDQFNGRVAFVPELYNLLQEEAGSVGYITTVSGRRCRFPMKAEGVYDWLHKALNRKIQGSAADQTKLAMVNTDREFPDMLQLQCHDELGFSSPDIATAVRVGDIMREADYGACVPFKVDVEVGPSWGQVKGI